MKNFKEKDRVVRIHNNKVVQAWNSMVKDFNSKVYTISKVQNGLIHLYDIDSKIVIDENGDVLYAPIRSVWDKGDKIDFLENYRGV